MWYWLFKYVLAGPVLRPITQPLVRQATDHLMQVLRENSRQEYVDTYATAGGMTRAPRLSNAG